MYSFLKKNAASVYIQTCYMTLTAEAGLLMCDIIKESQ